MKQAVFEARYKAFWKQCDALITALEAKQTEHCQEFIPAYRQLCQHLAIARQRGYSAHLTESLNLLNWRAHQLLYKRRSATFIGFISFFRFGFPLAVRNHARFIALAAVLMLLPALSLIAILQWQPAWVYYLADSHQLAQYEAMYDPSAEHIGRSRAAGSNVEMFGFYIRNNIGVAFRTFATGIVFTVGSMFFLIFNGVFFGVIAGHLTEIGYSQPFWTFVIAHAAFEITAIILAGAAGIKLGFSLLAPAQLSRLESLKRSAKELVPLLYGMTGMLIIAAFIEAFWSSDASLSAVVKYSVGGLLWVAVITYFLCAGHRRE